MGKRRGLLVTLEGVDGTGKSTLAKRLAAVLRRRGRSVTLTREPGGSPASARIRALLLDPAASALVPAAEALLFAADRRQHVEDTLVPALRRGDVVLCDRFTDSTRAYQGAGRSLPGAPLEAIAAYAADGLVPDLTLLLDLPPGEAARRATRRGGRPDRIERGLVARMGKVRRAFLALARREPGRVRVLRVAGLGPDAVLARALAVLDPLLAARR